MEMTKREYAEEVGKLIDETKEVKCIKKNGVEKMAVIIPSVNNSQLEECHYIDDAYESEMPIEECAKRIKNYRHQNSERVNELTYFVDEIKQFENVKDRLRLRLYNKTNEDCFQINRSAEQYGFDDLIMVPAINEDNFSAVVSKDIFNMWDITEDELFDTCIENMKPICEIMGMSETLKNMGAEFELDEDGRDMMYVISGNDRSWGAGCVIVALDEIWKRFPNGFIIIPSSIHEVIATEIPEDLDLPKYNSLVNLVNEVNETELEREDILGTKIYVFQ